MRGVAGHHRLRRAGAILGAVAVVLGVVTAGMSSAGAAVGGTGSIGAPSTTVVGSTASFTVTINNTGEADADPSEDWTGYTITDNGSVGLDSFSFPAGGALAAGSSDSVTVTARITGAPGSDADLNLTVSAVTADPGDTDPVFAVDGTPFAVTEAVTGVLTQDKSTVLLTDQITYTLTFTNASGTDAQLTGLPAAFAAPTGTTLASRTDGTTTVAAGGTSTWTLTVDVNDNLVNGATITQTIGTVQYAMSDISLAARDVPAITGSPATATVQAPAVTVTTHTITDLNGGLLDKGDTVLVTITVTNNGNAAANNVTVSSTLTNLTGPLCHDGTSSSTPVEVPCTTTATTVSDNIGTISGGSTGTLFFNATVVSAPSSTTARSDMTVTFGGGSSGASPINTPDAQATIASADLGILVSADPLEVVLDPDTATYDVTYQIVNNGPDPATGVTFTASRPTGATGPAVVQSAPAEWTCPSTGNLGSNPVTCAMSGELAKDASTSVVLRWTVDTAGASSFSGTVAGARIDPTTSNNTHDGSVAVAEPAATVTLETAASETGTGLSTVHVASFLAGSVTATYTVANSGPGNVKAELDIPVPAGTQLVSLSSTAGSCSPINPNPTATKTCSLNDGTGSRLDSGETETVTAVFTVLATDSPPATLAFNGTVRITKPTGRPNVTDASPAQVTTAAPFADLQVEVTEADPDVLQVASSGGFATLNVTVEVTNGGPYLAPGVQLTFANMGGTTASTETAGWTCAGTVCRTETDLGSGSTSTAVFTFNVNVPAGASHDLFPTASVAVDDFLSSVSGSVQTDPDGTNDSDGIVFQVNRAPAPQIDEAAVPPLPGAGSVVFDVKANDGADAEGDDFGVSAILSGGDCTTSGDGGITITPVSGTQVSVERSAGATATQVVACYEVEDALGGTAESRMVLRLAAPVYTTVGTSSAATATSVAVDPAALVLDTFSVAADPVHGNDPGPPVPLTNLAGLSVGTDALSACSSSPKVSGAVIEVIDNDAATAKVLRYRPASGFTSDPLTGSSDPFRYEEFCYRVTSSLATVTGQVMIRVVNAAPAALEDLQTTLPDKSNSFNPLVNDKDDNQFSAPFAGTPVSIDDQAGLRILCIGRGDADLTDTDCPPPPATSETAAPSLSPAAAGDGFLVETDKGTAVLITDPEDPDAFQSIVYTPKAGPGGVLPFGPDPITYVVVDPRGGTARGLVIVDIKNLIPAASDVAQQVFKNTPKIVVDASGLLDLNGQQIVISGLGTPAHGTAQAVNNNTQILYTPNRDYVGPDEFFYNVSDGPGGTSAEPATVSIQVVENPDLVEVAAGGGGSGGSPTGTLPETGANPFRNLAAGASVFGVGGMLLLAGQRRRRLIATPPARHARA